MTTWGWGSLSVLLHIAWINVGSWCMTGRYLKRVRLRRMSLSLGSNLGWRGSGMRNGRWRGCSFQLGCGRVMDVSTVRSGGIW